MKRRVLLIINPRAGRQKSMGGTFDIVNLFSGEGFEFTVKTTTGPGDATKIVTNNYEGHDMVVCCGGDGTLNETINGIMNLQKRLPMGYIPTGSTNDLAETIGIPVDIKKATELIIKGQTNSFDIGLFNNRYFCYAASFGAGTEISYLTPQKMKNFLGHSAYLLNGFVLKIIPLLKNLKPFHVKIEYDTGTIEDDFYFGAISNTTSIAGLFKFDKNDVRLNDGKFEVLLVRGLKNKAEAFELLRKVQKREYDGKQILYFKTERAKIISEQAVPWSLDGEYGGAHKEVRFDVISQAIDICSPVSTLFNR
jgi:diacylglycerol kinase (ATP)